MRFRRFVARIVSAKTYPRAVDFCNVPAANKTNGEIGIATAISPSHNTVSCTIGIYYIGVSRERLRAGNIKPQRGLFLGSRFSSFAGPRSACSVSTCWNSPPDRRSSLSSGNLNSTLVSFQYRWYTILTFFSRFVNSAPIFWASISNIRIQNRWNSIPVIVSPSQSSVNVNWVLVSLVKFVIRVSNSISIFDGLFSNIWSQSCWNPLR